MLTAEEQQELASLEAKVKFGRSPGASATSYDPTTVRLNYIWNELKKVPGAMFGMPVDVVTAGRDLVQRGITGPLLGAPPIDKSSEFGGSRSIGRGLGVNEEMRPLDKLAEYGGMAAQNLAYATPFAATRAVTAAPGILNRFVAATPDIAAGVGGAAGQVMGKEIGGRPGEVVGQIAGTAGGYRTGNVLGQAVEVGRDINQARKAAQEQGGAAYLSEKAKPEIARQAQNRTAEELRIAAATESRPKLFNDLDEYERLRTKFGIKQSAGEVTGNPYLLGKQSLVTHATEQSMADEIARRNANLGAIEKTRARVLPVPGKPLSTIAAAGRRRVDEQLSTLAQKEKELGTQLEDVSNLAISGAREQREVGTGLKATQLEMQKLDKQEADKLYGVFRKEVERAGNPKVMVGDIGKKIDDIRSKFSFDREPELFQKFETVKGEGKGTLKILQLDDLAKAAKSDLRNAQGRMNRDFVLERELGELIDVAQARMEKALKTAGASGALESLRTANRFFKETYVPRYRTGSNYEMTLKDLYGEQRIKPEAVVSEYFSSNRKNAATQAQRFRELYGASPSANQMLEAGVADLYRREVVGKGGGTIRQMSHDMFMRKYQDALNEFPQIKERLSGVGKQVGRLEAQLAEAGKAADLIRSDQLTKIYGSRDPQKLISYALESPSNMFSTISKMSKADREAFAGNILSRAWDEAISGQGKQLSAMLDNDNTMKMLLRNTYGAKQGQEHFDNLRDLAKVLEYQKRQPQLSGELARSQSSMKETLGFTPVSVWAALRATIAGRGSAPYFAGVFGGQALEKMSERKHIELLREALYDPQTLKNWLLVAHRKPESKSAVTWLMNKAKKLGSAIVGEGVGQAIAERAPLYTLETENVE